MKKTLLTCFFLSVFIYLKAQQFDVPDRMEFAGIKLKIKNDAKKEIQDYVNALTQNESYYIRKLALVEEYFPIIERVFREEGLPDDYKYLIIQESAFVPDAVSSSNAIGYWQFKRESAMEVGMRVDSKVDERMHIIASTRGAAKYLQKNNYYFNNWLNALQAYQMGAGGAMEVLGDKDSGAKSMDIDSKTYWYVKKFLAHKIAFESGRGKYKTDNYTLVEYTRTQNKTLKEIAKEVGIDESLLESYNKWLKVKKIPDDETNPVIVPLKSLNNLSSGASTMKTPVPDFDRIQQRTHPSITKDTDSENPFLVRINSLKGILAGNGETIKTLAEKGDIDEKKFIKFNDLSRNAKIIEDQVYYLEKKRNKSRIYFHTVAENETIWLISQKYGIVDKTIARYNRLKMDTDLPPGLVLWLHKKRPKDLPPQVRPQEEVTYRNEPIIAEVNKPEPLVEEISNEIKPQKAAEALVEADSLITTDSTSTNFPEEELAPKGEIANEILESSVEDSSIEDISAPENRELLKREIHTVEQGETFYSISRKYGISIADLLSWNQLSQDSVLRMDQKLEIRLNDKQKITDIDKTYTKHTVSKGDTLYRISKLYDVDLDDILMWNNKVSSELKIGETILIKNK